MRFAVMINQPGPKGKRFPREGFAFPPNYASFFMLGGAQEIKSFGVQKLVGVTLLFLIFLAGFPGSGGAVKPGPTSTREPEAFRKLGASVAGLRFFATPTSEAVPMKARVYRTSFFN